MSNISKTPKAAQSPKSATAGSGAGAKGKTKLPMPLILGGGIFLFFIFIFIFLAFGRGNNEPVEQKTEVVIPQSEQLNDGQAPIIENNDAAYPVDATVVNDPFNSPDPVQSITEEAVTTTIESDPAFTQGSGFLMPDGTLFAVNTTEFNALKQEIGAPVHASLSSVLSSRDTEMGMAWFYADVQKTGETLPLASTEVQTQVMAEAVRTASGELQQIKDRYSAAPVAVVQEQPVAVQQVEPQVQIVEKVVEVSSINDEERQLLNSIIQELRAQNRSNRSDLQAAKEDKRSVERELVQLRQRVEDNPALKNVVRATMLPKSSGYKLDSVMADKIFLRNIKTDELVILQKGQSIPDTTYRIDSADMDTGIVLVMPSK